MAVVGEKSQIDYIRRGPVSWEQAASRYLDGEVIDVTLPTVLGDAIGCSAIRAGVLLRSLGWYSQRSKQQKNTVYFRDKAAMLLWQGGM